MTQTPKQVIEQIIGWAKTGKLRSTCSSCGCSWTAHVPVCPECLTPCHITVAEIMDPVEAALDDLDYLTKSHEDATLYRDQFEVVSDALRAITATTLDALSDGSHEASPERVARSAISLKQGQRVYRCFCCEEPAWPCPTLTAIAAYVSAVLGQTVEA